MNFQSGITSGINPSGSVKVESSDFTPAAVGLIVSNKNPITTLFPENGVVGDASFLASHFGIVPGVLTGTWMMENRGNLPIHAFTRKYNLPIIPGTRLEKGIDNGTVIVIGDKAGENRQTLAQMTFNIEEADYKNHTIPDDIEDIVVHNGADWIPHGDKFRFCDTVGHQGDMLVGRYTVKNTYITEAGMIPFWQIEEACSQMMLGAYRTKKGEDSPYGTYAEARTKGTEDFNDKMSQLKPGDKIICVGSANDVTDDRGRVKQTNFIYTCFVNGVGLFQGNIIGNVIPKKIWERQFNRTIS